MDFVDKWKPKPYTDTVTYLDVVRWRYARHSEEHRLAIKIVHVLTCWLLSLILSCTVAKGAAVDIHE